MRHNPYYSFVFMQPLSVFILAIKRLPSHIASSQDTFTQLLSKVFLDKYNKTFSCDLTWSIMTKMHYKEELDLVCRCNRANISIMLHKTIYEINSTLLLKTHFKHHHRVFVITSFCDHMWNFGHLQLLKYMLFIAFYIAAKISISDVHLKKIT